MKRNSILGGDPYTSGQLLRQGLLLSWNKFGREVFCSFAIILCKASFSSPSLSKIWKRMKQSTISCWQPGLASSPRPQQQNKVNSREVGTGRRLVFSTLHCEQHSLWPGNSGAFGKYCCSLLQASLETSLLSFSDIHNSPEYKKNFFLHLNQKSQRTASQKYVFYFLNLRKTFSSFLKCSILWFQKSLILFILPNCKGAIPLRPSLYLWLKNQAIKTIAWD